jgi:hypothetical protein
MTHNLTKLEVLPLKHCTRWWIVVSIKGAVIIAAGIVFVAALVGIFA